MALTRDFRQTVQARARRDPAYRKGLLTESIESLLGGEVAAGRDLLRDYINTTVGFPKLAALTGLHVKTLHRIFGPNGNPTAGNLFEVVACLQRAEGVQLEVRPARRANQPTTRSSIGAKRSGARPRKAAGWALGAKRALHPPRA